MAKVPYIAKKCQHMVALYLVLVRVGLYLIFLCGTVLIRAVSIIIRQYVVVLGLYLIYSHIRCEFTHYCCPLLFYYLPWS